MSEIDLSAYRGSKGGYFSIPFTPEVGHEYIHIRKGVVAKRAKVTFISDSAVQVAFLNADGSLGRSTTNALGSFKGSIRSGWLPAAYESVVLENQRVELGIDVNHKPSGESPPTSDQEELVAMMEVVRTDDSYAVRFWRHKDLSTLEHAGALGLMIAHLQRLASNDFVKSDPQ